MTVLDQWGGGVVWVSRPLLAGLTGGSGWIRKWVGVEMSA